jgi:hypothetical protein
MRHIRTLYIFLIFILLSSTPFLHAATEQRIALVIGNGAYESGRLKNPANDAADMATTLNQLGFSVTLKKDASRQEMEESIENFGNRLKRGGVGLFYFAGHGVQINGINYLIPIGAKINKESDVKYEAIDANRVLDEIANANNGINIVMFDACRDNPYARRFRNAARGLAIVSTAPTGTFISYSTGPGQVAQDGDGRNSPYSVALIHYMKQPGLTIEQVFKSVRAKLGKETGGKQVPWELSSLQGEFFFIPKKGISAVEETATSDLDNEQRKIEADKQRLEREEALLSEKTAIGEKRRQLEEKKKQLAIVGKRPSESAANEIGRDDRFIAYDDGTVLDTSTNLMWAAKDSGREISWWNANSYCENYRAGGYTDWRMPPQNELARLYDMKTKWIKVTNWVWASETRSGSYSGSYAAYFDFSSGVRGWSSTSAGGTRVLPVRSGK